MLRTYPPIGDTDDPGIAADHQEDEAEQRHVPSAKQRHKAGIMGKFQNMHLYKKALPAFLSDGCLSLAGYNFNSNPHVQYGVRV